MNIERRIYATDFEVRTNADGTNVIDGYAAKFNRFSQDLGGFVEQIQAGAFAKTIQESDVRALFNHDPNIVLGRNKAGTLRMSEDATGLYYQVDLPNTSAARDLAESMRRGDVSQSSFGFVTINDTWDKTERGYPLRTLNEVRLFDVSPVTYPAYLDTASAVRGAVRRLAEVRGIEPDFAAAHLAELIDGRDVSVVTSSTATQITITPDMSHGDPTNHPFKDVNGDGICDECGYDQAGHDTNMGGRSATPAETTSLSVLRARLELLRHTSPAA